MCGVPAQPWNLPVSEPAGPWDGVADADPGDCAGADSIGASEGPGAAAPGGLASGKDDGEPIVSGTGMGATADRRRFRALPVMDASTRESWASEPGQSLKGEAVVRVLQRIQKNRGGAKRLFCDNGSEFSSRGLDLWAYPNRVRIAFSRHSSTATAAGWHAQFLLSRSGLRRAYRRVCPAALPFFLHREPFPMERLS